LYPQSTLSPLASAKLLVEALLRRGIDTYFGIPGGPICPMFDAIRCTRGARLVESRHESNAAFAAAAYARASGRVPVVIVTAGPGATNAVTGVASASLERTPMLVIAGDVSWSATGRVLAQDSGPEGLSLESIFSSITRATIRAAHARSVVAQALAALDAATDPVHPGPSLFVLPLDIAMGESSAIEIASCEPAAARVPPAWTLESTLRILQNAKRPLLVLGDLCRGHEKEVTALADALAIPFVTTPEAKGVVSELHRFSLRNGGMAASIWARRYTSEPVDACLALGTNLDDTVVGPTRYIGAGGQLIHVHPQAAVFGRNFPTALAVNATPGDFSRAFREHAKRSNFSHPTAERLVAMARESSPFDVADAATDSAAPIRPHRLLLDLQRSIGPGARFVTDIGEHMLFALHYLTAQEPGSFQIQLNLGSMGSGVAGAIGLSLADRSRRVACVVGDGCMQMAGMEVLVALRQRLPILFVVFNDSRYNMVHHGMKQIFGDASPYDTPPIDFAAWARSFNMPAATVTRPAELTPDLVSGLMAHEGPALIDARIDSSVRIRGGGRVEALQHMSIAETRAASAS